MPTVDNYLYQHYRHAQMSSGFVAKKEEFCDMVKGGVVDPVKVTRIAIQNAASVAGLIITTEATIFDEPKKECECSAGAGMGAGMGSMGGMGY